MTFSPEWEKLYSEGTPPQIGEHQNLHWLMTTFAPNPQEMVLEFGCGRGDNARYWIERGANFHGIEGSRSAIESLLGRYPYLKPNVACADFTRERPFSGPFDIVFDRAAISHNDGAGIVRALDYAWDVLRPGGLFFGCDWFSTLHSEYGRGESEDQCTRSNYPDGQFKGIGRVHFSSHEDLGELFTRFEPVLLQHRIMHRPPNFGATMLRRLPWQSPAFDGRDYLAATWEIVARKPS